MSGQIQYSGPTTTSNSDKEGRLKVGIVDPDRKKRLLRNIIKKRSKRSRDVV